ncbi:MAG: hydroxyethylthiazole kinase [Pseudorhodoplanes sp.]|nr:hydroxyethylthiazole kinase [Pseudorhodoplanes sp.]
MLVSTKTGHARGAAGDLTKRAGDVLARLRAGHPRVHCITNTVAQAFTANVLLAAGALPTMTTSPEEVGDFVACADALLVNLGTFDEERRGAVDVALSVSAGMQRPWVLDPVLIDRSDARTRFARALLARRPAIVRLNGPEFCAVSGLEPIPSNLVAHAGEHGTVLALTGAADIVTDGTRIATVANGHPFMAHVTAMGCAASALTAACLAVDDDPFAAAVAALLMLNIAGEIAGKRSEGPGSFAATILDALYRLDAETLSARARVS